MTLNKHTTKILSLAKKLDEDINATGFISKELVEELRGEVAKLDQYIADIADIELVKKFADWQFRTGRTIVYIDTENTAVTNPWYEESGRFGVNPLEEYGAEEFHDFCSNVISVLNDPEKLKTYDSDVVEELISEGLITRESLNCAAGFVLCGHCGSQVKQSWCLLGVQRNGSETKTIYYCPKCGKPLKRCKKH